MIAFMRFGCVRRRGFSSPRPRRRRTSQKGQSSQRLERTGVTPERVLRDIDTAANLDIGLLFDDDGRLKSCDAITFADTTAAPSHEFRARSRPPAHAPTTAVRRGIFIDLIGTQTAIRAGYSPKTEAD
jgi:hypothetical protein